MKGDESRVSVLFGPVYGDVVRVEAWGDPAGKQRAQTDEKTCFQIMKEHADLDIEWLTDRTKKSPACAGTMQTGLVGRVVLSGHATLSKFLDYRTSLARGAELRVGVN